MTKIKYVNGNLLDAPEFIIAHGCNAQGVMNRGVARAIRKKWPTAYNAYCFHYEMTQTLQLGEVIWCKTDGKLIANCITQEKYGCAGAQYTNYLAVRKCMQKINKIAIRDLGVAMPLIGAGLGGGDWDIIAQIIEEEIINDVPTVYILPSEWDTFKNRSI
ncbi:MAG: hypothetical protein HC836_23315 [Richelia sp. RM2_1_2]|nr:hypothetical protein [Richelia sp. RM2_1_2]